MEGKRTPEELKNIALDLLHGRIFTDRHIDLEHPENLKMVFMCFAFMNREQLESLLKDPPALIFEYLDKAGPRSINGMPTFLSAEMLSREEAAEMLDYYIKLKAAEKQALETV